MFGSGAIGEGKLAGSIAIVLLYAAGGQLCQNSGSIRNLFTSLAMRHSFTFHFVVRCDVLLLCGSHWRSSVVFIGCDSVCLAVNIVLPIHLLKK